MPRDEYIDEEDDADCERALPPLPARPLRGAARDPKPGKRDQVAASIEAIDAYKSAFEARASNELDRVVLSTDSEYWVALCFESRAQKEAFLARMKLSDMGDKHLDGLEVARRLGVPFSKEERVQWPKRRGFDKLAQLAGDADEEDEEARKEKP